MHVLFSIVLFLCQMCLGKFVDPLEIDSSANQGPSRNSVFETQVAFGTDTGAIYIMTNFEVNSCERWQITY